MQLLINQTTLEVICAAIGKGREHNFKIFKESKIIAMSRIQVLADKGYQGIKNYHNNSKIPHKKSKIPS